MACGIFKNVGYMVERLEKTKQKSKKVVVPILTQSCQAAQFLVGAMTHVLVNDPTTGYGIQIKNMLDAAE